MDFPAFKMITFLSPPLFKYLAIIALVLGVEFYVFNLGEDHVQTKWDAANAETEKQIMELKTKADAITAKIETKYVDRIVEVKTKGDTIVKYVPQYVTTADNDHCIINNGFVRVLDAAAKNELPDAANETDARPSDVKLAEVASVTAGNLSICHQYIEQNAGLKEWIREQRAVNP